MSVSVPIAGDQARPANIAGLPELEDIDAAIGGTVRFCVGPRLDAMDRAMWQEHLAIAERHVAEARQHIVRQRQIIFELRRCGHNTTTAQAVLATFKATLRAHIEDRDRLKAELSR